MCNVAMEYEEQQDDDELMWVKAGGPGEKPLIIRQVRSESSSSGSRDNSGGSTSSNRVKFLRPPPELRAISSETIERLGTTSSNDSQVIVVNVEETNTYRSHSIDREKIRRWKELNSPNSKKKPINNNIKCSPSTDDMLTKSRSKSQPINPLQVSPSSRCSPSIPRCESDTRENESKLALHVTRSLDHVSQKSTPKPHDEGYTSLSEECKDSDNELRKSQTLPSSWRGVYYRARHDCDLSSFAKRMANDIDDSVNFDSCLETEALQPTPRKLKQKKRRHHVESAIETFTCLVCLRSAVYHSSEDDTGGASNHPCACTPANRGCKGRWASIALLTCCLPLLIFYPPFKLCLVIHDARVRRKKAKKEKKLLHVKLNL